MSLIRRFAHIVALLATLKIVNSQAFYKPTIIEITGIDFALEESKL